MNAKTETVIDNALKELDKVRDTLIKAITIGVKDATSEGEQVIDFGEAIDSASASPISKVAYNGNDVVTAYDMDSEELSLNDLTVNELNDIAAKLINNDYNTVDKGKD